MYQNMPNYYQPQMRNMPSQQGLKGYPVSSLEEARAAIIDFDGSIFVFPDLANKRVYTKQINLDGTVTLNMYEKTELPPPQSAIDSTQYVSKTDLENVIAELKTLITANKSQSIETKKSNITF